MPWWLPPCMTGSPLMACTQATAQCPTKDIWHRLLLLWLFWLTSSKCRNVGWFLEIIMHAWAHHSGPQTKFRCIELVCVLPLPSLVVQHGWFISLRLPRPLSSSTPTVHVLPSHHRVFSPAGYLQYITCKSSLVTNQILECCWPSK